MQSNAILKNISWLGAASILVKPLWFVFITILSGTGNVAATYVGALVFELIRVYAFEYFPHIWQMILGVVLLGFILFLPDGLWSLRDRFRKARG